MRELMGVFYGYEVSTEGDAFLVAFHEPFDAVAWCLATQLALHCE
jgi:class 3 adenylate cyclase